MAAFRRSESTVRVVRGSLEVCAHQEIDVFERHSVLRHATPRNIVGRGRVAGGRRIPILAWIEVALHVPGTRSVVDAVFGGGGAESRARIEMVASQRRAATAITATVHIDVSESARRLESEAATCSRAHSAVKVVRIHEFTQIGTAHEFTLGVEGVVEVEIVDAELVGDGRIAVVRHAAGDPMVSADRFDIPDFVYVGNDDAIRFVGAVCFKQFGETCDAFACRGYVRQHKGDDVFFSDSARNFRGISGFVRRLQFNERISGQHALVDCDGFGGAHRHIVLADARFRENSAIWQHIWHNAVSAWIVGKIDFDMTEHTAVMPRLVLRRDRNEFLRIVTAGTGIIVACDDSGAVVAGFLSYKNRGT